jgi:hypothetical protein
VGLQASFPATLQGRAGWCWVWVQVGVLWCWLRKLERATAARPCPRAAVAALANAACAAVHDYHPPGWVPAPPRSVPTTAMPAAPPPASPRVRAAVFAFACPGPLRGEIAVTEACKISPFLRGAGGTPFEVWRATTGRHKIEGSAKMTGSFMALLSRPCVPRLQRRRAARSGALRAPPGRLRRPANFCPNTENAPNFSLSARYRRHALRGSGEPRSDRVDSHGSQAARPNSRAPRG